MTVAAPLMDGIEFQALFADKAFNSKAIITDLDERGAKVVISQHSRRAMPRQIDAYVYKWRHLIEDFFCKLKEFKRIGMRACKTDGSFEVIIYLAAAVINSRCPPHTLDRRQCLSLNFGFGVVSGKAGFG